MKNILLLLLVVMTTIGCKQSLPAAQEIVDEAINFSNINKLAEARASFVFRGIEYAYYQSGGTFQYVRKQLDTLQNEVEDQLTNDRFTRLVNGKRVELPDEKKAAYSSSINSVIYFAFLPYSLNDVAVNKSYEGTTSIHGTTYHKIKVTFNQEGGGEDFDDIFYYWFDTEDYSMDYLAYSYEEKHGRGLRFRSAYNSRRVNGVLIQDYKNLKPKEKGAVTLDKIDLAFINDELIPLSLIELEDVVIE